MIFYIQTTLMVCLGIFLLVTFTPAIFFMLSLWWACVSGMWKDVYHVIRYGKVEPRADNWMKARNGPPPMPANRQYSPPPPRA